MLTLFRFVTLAAFATASGTGYANAPQFPLDVACLLSMEKSATSKPPPIESQPRSCNDFVVTNARELRLVEGACKFSNSYKGWSYKIVYGPCDTATAFAVCHVPDAKNPTIVVDTFYYTSSQNPSSYTTEAQLFEEDCKVMAGEFELLNTHSL